eukprot:GHVP01051225.1.p1 GENE.GHVP01051225.1~~GHVP01051225.1.p1  ORF type:complete len:183 (+),score=27.11 GHVP01051225.1:32-550(+)
MTFEVDLFKLSEDTKAIFLQLVDFSTDDEVPRRNFSTSELTFHGCLQSKVAVKKPISSEADCRFENFCEVHARANPPEMKGEDSQGTTNKVDVKKPSATASSSTDKAGRSAVQGDSIVDSERPQAEKSMGLQVATKKVVSKVKFKENLATFHRMRLLDTTEVSQRKLSLFTT